MKILNNTFSRHYGPLAFAIVVSCLLLTPIFKVGFQNDDFHIRAILLDKDIVKPIDDASLFGLFSFFSGEPSQIVAKIESGLAPWFSSKSIKLQFFRPITEMNIWLDYWLWPNTAPLMHLHGLLWFIAGLVLLHCLYKNIYHGSDHYKVILGLAIIIYAIDSNHGLVLGWLCQRGSLIANVFCILALIFHHKYQHTSYTHIHYYIAPIFSFLGLLSAEASLSLFGFLLSYAIFLSSDNSLFIRLLRLWPYGIVLLIWYAMYQSIGFGTSGFASYINPVNEPQAFIANFPSRLLLLLTGIWSNIPAEFFQLIKSEDKTNLLIIVSIYLLVMTLVSLPILRTSSSARFWFFGILIALIPNTMVIYGSRMLFITSIGAAPFIAELLVWYWVRRSQFTFKSLVKLLTAAAVVLQLLTHTVFSAFLLPIISFSPYIRWEPGKTFLESIPIDDTVKGKDIILLNPPLASLAIQTTMYRHLHDKPIGDANWVLASHPNELNIKRLDESSILLTGTKPLVSKNDWTFRTANDLFTVGDTFKYNGMTAKIEQVNQDSQPMSVTFTFDAPLIDKNFYIIAWVDSNTPIKYELPSPNSSVDIAWNNIFLE